VFAWILKSRRRRPLSFYPYLNFLPPSVFVNLEVIALFYSVYPDLNEEMGTKPEREREREREKQASKTRAPDSQGDSSH
jgi:hypothetical protein